MAGEKAFTGNLPTVGNQRSATEIKNALNDLLGFVNQTFADSATAGNANEFLMTDGAGVLSWGKAIRSDVNLENDAGAGSAGQYLKSDGDGTLSWDSIIATAAASEKTGDFSTAANGVFIVSTGVNTVTLHSPSAVGESFTLMPKLGTRSFTSSPPSMAGSVLVNGLSIDSGYLSEDAHYRFISLDGTNWHVTGELFDV